MCLGIPGQIVEIADAATRSAVVSVGGVRRTVNVAFIVSDLHPVESCIGDWVLVHVGFAISKVDAEEAARTYKYLEEMDQLGEVTSGDEVP